MTSSPIVGLGAVASPNMLTIAKVPYTTDPEITPFIQKLLETLPAAPAENSLETASTIAGMVISIANVRESSYCTHITNRDTEHAR